MCSHTTKPVYAISAVDVKCSFGGIAHSEVLLECERLKAQHKLITKHMQSNFSAPILADLQKGIKVLDAGCGEWDG